MSNRAATILAVAAVISSLCIYGAFAQAPQEIPMPQGGAIVVQPPSGLGQQLPGRYELSAVSSAAGVVNVVAIDTHTGQCWLHSANTGKWHDLGSPVEKKDGN